MQKQEIYNLLPSFVKVRFGVIYSELVADNITIFRNVSKKWGVLVATKRFGIFPGYKLLVRGLFDSAGFNRELQLLEMVEYDYGNFDSEKNIYSFFDLQGNLVWRSEKGVSVNIDQHGYPVINKNGKYGALNKNFEQLIAPVYDRIASIGNDHFIAGINDTYGIINGTGKIILDISNNMVFQPAANNKVIVENQSGQYYSFDLKTTSKAPLPFDKVLRASSNSYGAPSNEALSLFKTMIDCREIGDDGAFSQDEYEMSRYTGKWGIANADGNIVIPNEYDYVDFLRNPGFFKVCKGKLNFTYKEINGEERLVAEGGKWGIIDSKNNVIVPFEYDWIDEIGQTLWKVCKNGTVFYNDDYQEDYWAVDGGTLGIYNFQKLIVPIEYGSIFTTWYRVKDYIFVRKATDYFSFDKTDYDVFTFNGKRIEQNKPSPRNHMNNS